MERSERWRRRVLLALRPHTCCRVAPLRTGLLVIGYFNMLVSVLLIVGTASSTFVPMCVRVQESVVEEPSPSTCILGPSAELGLSVLLLAAAYRSDVILLRIYSWLALAALAAAVLVYCLVVALIGALYLIAIAASLIYQSYVILLVRSFIIEIKFKDTIGKTTLYYDKRLDIVRDPEAARADAQGSTVILLKDTDTAEKTSTVAASEKEKPSDAVQVTSNLPSKDIKGAVSTPATVVSVHESADGRATIASKEHGTRQKTATSTAGKDTNVSVVKETASVRAIFLSGKDGGQKDAKAVAGNSKDVKTAVESSVKPVSSITIGASSSATVASVDKGSQQKGAIITSVKEGSRQETAITAAAADASKDDSSKGEGSQANVASGEEGQKKDAEITEPAPTPKKRRGWFRRGARDSRDKHDDTTKP